MTFTAEQLNDARKGGYSDDEIWSYLGEQDQGFSGAKEAGYSLDEVAGYFGGIPKPETDTSAGQKLQTATEELEAGIGRAGGAFAQAAVGSVKMISDAFGANNPVSKKISGVEDYLDQFVTAQAKQDKQEISRLFQEAEDKGLGAKVLAGLQAVAVSPETLGPELAGYMLPSLAAGVLTGGASIPVQIGAQAALGGIQAAGSIKGNIYTSVRDYAREQGLDEDKADKLATEAQAYGGKNLDQILIGAGIGAAAASTGAERIITKLLTKGGKEVTKKSIGEFIKNGFKAGGVEAITEGTQEAQEQIASNLALQREGADVPTFRNVPQVATMGAAAGGLMGGAVGGIEILSAEQREERYINRDADKEARNLLVPEADSATQATVNDLNQRENAVQSLQEELDTLEPTDPKAQQLRLRISEEQKKTSDLKSQLSLPITTAEQQQIELAKQIARKPAQLGAMPSPAAQTAEATYGAATGVYDVFGGITRKPVSIPKPAKLPTAPTIEEQTAERTYGGETGVFDVFAGARRKPVTPAVTPAQPVAEAPAITPAPVAETPAVAEAPAAEVAPSPIVKQSKKRKGILGEQYINKDWTSLTKDELPQLNRELYNYYDWAKTVADKLIPNANDFEKKALIMELRNEITQETAKPEFKDREQYILAQKVAGELITGKRKKILQRAKERAMGDEYAAWEMGGRFEGSPISVEAFDSNAKGRPIPKGYTKQGDLYVYQPAVTEAPAAEVAPAEEGQFSIYQMERKDGMRWLVQSGEKRGFGDAIFNTKEDAEKYASDEKLRQQQRASMVEREAQIKRDEEAAKELREKNVNEFTTAIGATPIAAGKIKKTLMEKAAKRTGGKVYEGTRAEIVEQFVAIGFKPTISQVDAVKDLTRAQFNRMDNRQQAEFEKKKKAAGKKNEYRLENAEGYLFDVTKAEYDYANWLESRTEIQPTPAVSEAPAAEPAGKPEEVTPRKPATFPTMPSIEEQTAEKVYGGETGLYDPFAGIQKKRAKAEDPAGRRGTEDQIKNADEHAAEIGGTVLYQDGDISLIRGYSLWGGNPVYIVANKISRARTDISSYTGNLVTPEQKTQLVDIKNKIEAEDQASFNSKPFITFTDGIAFSNGVPSTIAGVLRDWKSLLNLKANLYVTTYDDAVADKDKFNGPHRVIGSAGLASSKVDGSIREMPNGDFYIMFREIPSRTKMLETLAHELGHLHEKEAFENADTATKEMLREEHDKWVKSQTGKTAKELTTSLRAAKTAKANLGAAEGMMADELSEYWKSFGEWYADQVSRWAVSAEKPLTIVDKFFSRIAKALRSFYANLTNRGYLPNETFVQYLEKTLKEPARIVSEPIMEGEGVEQLSQQLGGEPTTEPAPEKPVESKRREKIMGVEAGPLIETQDGIIAKTKDKLKTLFDPEVVNEANTSTAYRAIGILSGANRDAARQYAESINALTAEGLGEDADTSNEISMGAALFVNNLFEYAVKLAAKGDRKMLGLMVSNINKLPTGQVGASDAGRTLRARVELKARFLMMAQAEQDAFTSYVAEFIYGPNPTEAQIKSIKDAYSATQKVTQPTTEELTEEIAKVGEKTNTDLVSKINDDFTKAAEKTADARDAELKELSDEYNKIQDKAETEIEKLAEIQSDTPSFARRVVNEIRAIVSADLKQKPDLGRKAPWKSMLIAKLQNAGVSPANAETLADLVWRQHEINATSRELDSINKAIEKGPISEIIKQIKDTPIEQQQDPKWRYEVMRDYLRKAGLPIAQAERIAKLMDISLQKRFTEAKEKAFTESIEKSAPWKSGDARSKRAFQQVIKAIRAGALDPSRNFLNDVAAANGWTGFTDSQYAKLIKLDGILSDPKSSDADKAEAHKAIQNIISNSKLPIRARDVIGQFYDAQALSGIPTITVNMVSPIGMAAKNALVQAASGVATFRPDQIDAAFRTLMDSIKSWVNTVAYSFKNNVTVYSNVEYLVNDEGLLKLYNRGREQFKKGKTPKDRADGVKNMMVGMWDYVRRILNALDYGAIASLQNQTVPKYALAAMQAKGMSSKDGTKMLNAMFEAKRNFYEQQIAAGVDKNKASVLADEFFVSSWRQALTDAKLPAQQVIDSAINDSMSAVGRTRASLDNFRDENTNLQDAGVTSMPALWLLQSMANAANKSDSQIVKIFARIIYGFAVVPARVFRETAWFSPYGYVRFAYDAIAKKKGLNSPYAQSLGNDLQYRQRMNEATAGTLVMLGLASAFVSSIDDEDDERPFKIVVTGNGPNRADDPQFYDSWIKNNTPNSVRIQFGKTKFTINTMRGFEAFAWPAMMLGAVDDWKIRRKMNRKQNEPVAVGDAAIVAGNVFSAALKRGPYAFAAKPLFESYGDRTVESLFKSLAFPVKTLIPGVGSSLARNFSDLLNEPIDRRTLDGALWANVPFIGPAVAPKAMNAFGEPALAGEASDKLFKLGVPIVFKIGTDRDSVNIHNLVLKQGSGPSIPTRNQLAKRLDREPTNKEYELFVKEYGSFISEKMKKRYKEYDEMKPETYDKAIQKLSDVARDEAERVVRLQKTP